MYRRCGFRYEKKLRALGVVRIAGIDEAGRGALAGPVVAAAVILPEKFRHRKLKDSKQLLPELRQEIYDELVSRDDIVWSIGVVDSFEIDQINILRATHKAMRFALEGLLRAARACAHRRTSGLAISSAANRDHRWRLHQSFHCRRERDRESDAGSFNA